MIREVVLAENVLADPEGRLSFYSMILDRLAAPAFPGRLRRLAALVRWESPVPFRARAALFGQTARPWPRPAGRSPRGPSPGWPCSGTSPFPPPASTAW